MRFHELESLDKLFLEQNNMVSVCVEWSSEFVPPVLVSLFRLCSLFASTPAKKYNDSCSLQGIRALVRMIFRFTLHRKLFEQAAIASESGARIDFAAACGLDSTRLS